MYNELPTMELDRTENVLSDEVTKSTIEVENRHINVRLTPGLGVAVDIDALGKYKEREIDRDEATIEVRA